MENDTENNQEGVSSYQTFETCLESRAGLHSYRKGYDPYFSHCNIDFGQLWLQILSHEIQTVELKVFYTANQWCRILIHPISTKEEGLDLIISSSRHLIIKK